MSVHGFDQPYLFGDSERRQLGLIAARAVGTLQVARRISRDRDLLAQMDEALTSRSVIDQALGFVMGQQRSTARTAFDLLRRESRDSRRLRDIAADLVTRTTGHPADTDASDLRAIVRTLPVIEQAKGMLMGLYRMDADTAFSLLRRWSRTHHVTIVELATTLVDGPATHDLLGRLDGLGLGLQ